MPSNPQRNLLRPYDKHPDAAVIQEHDGMGFHAFSRTLSDAMANALST